MPDRCGRWAAGFLLVALPVLVRASESDDEPLPPDPLVLPIVRPGSFTGAIGRPIRQHDGRLIATLTAEPRSVPVESPLTLTLTLANLADAESVERPDLTPLERDFAIDPLPDPPATEGTRRFVWRLRPLHGGNLMVPSLPLTYWRPGVQPPSAGFMTTDTGPPIAIAVTARQPDTPQPLVGLAWLFAPPVSAPSPSSWAVLGLLAPPGLFALGYWLRRHFRPDAAQARWLRHSRAARRAVVALESAATPMAVRSAVVTYLGERFDVPAHAATPSDVGAYLPVDAAGTVAVLAATDARFALVPPPTPTLAEQARTLIACLEEACSRSS